MDRLKKNRMENVKRKLGDYRYYKILLFIMIGVTAFVVYGTIVFSGHQYVYYDIGGGDEPEAYIPLFVSYINQIKTGTLSSWTFYNGLGTSTTAVFGFLLNPFLLLVFVCGIIFGISTINTMLLVSQILNIFVCGLLCYQYLNNFKGSSFSKAVASYIFAFNGYMILYAQHYVHSDFCFYLLIMLILIEKIKKSKRIEKWHIFFALWCMVLFTASIYIGYMIGLFCGIYFIFRLLQEYKKEEIKEAFANLGRMIGFALAGIALAMPLILPVANELLFNSTRITGDNAGLFTKIKTFLVTPYPAVANKTIFFRMLSNNLEAAGNDFFGVTGNSVTDYYAAPTLFFSIFIFTFVFIYYVTLFRREKNHFQRLVRILAGLAVVFLMFNQLGSAAFNAFVATFGRYSYLLMPLFAIVSMTSLDEMAKMRQKQKWLVIFASFIVFLVIFFQYKLNLGCGRPRYYMIFVKLELVILLAAMILFGLYRSKNRKIIILLFTGLIVANVTLDSYVTVNKRVFCDFSRDLTDEDDEETMDALAYVQKKDTDMYRLEKNYYDLIYYHDAYFQGYYGLSTYNSTLNGNVKEFYRMYCNPAINFYSPDSFWYSFMNVSNDITQNTLLGIRYILSNKTAYPDEKYEQVYTNGKISVYKNKEAESFGTFYQHFMGKSDVEKLDMNDREKVLSDAVVLEDEDMRKNSDLQIGFDEVKEDLGQKDITDKIVSYQADENAEIYLTFDPELSKQHKTNFMEFSTDLDYDNHIMIYFDCGDGKEELTPYYHRGSADGSQSQARIMLPEGIKSVRLCSSKDTMKISNLKIISVDAPITPKTAVPRVKLVKNNTLKGQIQNEKEGFLFLPVPFEEGWEAFVDGERVPVLKADSGFMAIRLSPGNHNFELKYNYPGITIGMVMACLSGIVLLILCFWMKHEKRRRE